LNHLGIIRNIEKQYAKLYAFAVQNKQALQTVQFYKIMYLLGCFLKTLFPGAGISIKNLNSKTGDEGRR